MYKLEKHPRREEERFNKNPTFSSSLLDEIYRSMAEGDQDKNAKFHSNEPKSKKQSFPKGGEKEERDVLAFHRACLIEKWMDQKVSEKIVSQQKRKPPQFDRHYDQDPLFFSSTSSSSDSSSGGFSSSDNDSFFRTRPKASSCPLNKKPPKPIRTAKTLFYEQREEEARVLDDDLIKSKSRALKMYNNLKKAKQPISPGGKLATFINSLFQAGQNGKKEPKNSESTCSSASSYSRSCLSKNSHSTREKLRNGVKRNVTFHPVEQPEFDRKPKVEAAAREFLKEYRHKKGSNILPGTRRDCDNSNHRFGGEDDDDATSCSSSDLFELDHLSMIRADYRYREELPVYETTRVETNRAIASGFRV